MRYFQSTTGILIKVGQNANENDQLVKTSHQDHVWCHLENGPSPHAVIEAASPDAQTLDEALQLVKHFSKGKGIQARMIISKIRDLQRDRQKPGLVRLKKAPTKWSIRTDVGVLMSLGIEPKA